MRSHNKIPKTPPLIPYLQKVNSSLGGKGRGSVTAGQFGLGLHVSLLGCAHPQSGSCAVGATRPLAAAAIATLA